MTWLIYSILLSLFAPQSPQTVKINEVCAKGGDFYTDVNNERDDWVEFYNPGPQTVDLAGWFFSDTPENPTRYQFPEGMPMVTTLAPGQRLLLWIDQDLNQGPLHADFKLSSRGETVLLSNPDTLIVDSVTYPIQFPYGTYSRIPDGGNTWLQFPYPTPNKPNLRKIPTDTLEQPKFSISGGFVDKGTQLRLTCSNCGPLDSIYYTTTGIEPSLREAKTYRGPISIDSSIAIRARVIGPKTHQSEVVQHTFLVGEPATLPVITFITDPYYLWDSRNGVFHEDNTEAGLKALGFVAYYGTDKLVKFEQEIGFKLQGRYSRWFDKKSISFMAKKKYGVKKIKYPLFKDRPYKKYNGFSIRADCNYAGYTEEERRMGGDRIRNELIYELNKQMGEPVDMQAYEPVLFYLNGEFWGLYTMIEKKNPQYLKHKYGIKKKNLDMLNPAAKPSGTYLFEVYDGDSKEWDKFETWVEQADLSVPEAYDTLSTFLDIDNFIDGWVYEIYTAKGDPTLNARLYRERKPGARWRSIAFDWDHWKDWDHTTVTTFSEKTRGKSKLFRLFIENERFRAAFAHRMCDYLNTVMQPENVKRLVKQIDERVKEEKIRDRESWKNWLQFMEMGKQVEQTLEWADKRPQVLYDNMAEVFDLPGTAVVNLEVKGEGTIRINRINPQQYPWKGTYMQGLPLPLEAVPAEGWKFKGWKKNHRSRKEKISITLQHDMELVAVFKKVK